LNNKEVEINRLKEDYSRSEQENRELLKRFSKLAEDHESRMKIIDEKHHFELNEIKSSLNEIKLTNEKEKLRNESNQKELIHLNEIISKLEKEIKLNEQNNESKCLKIIELNDEITNLKIKLSGLDIEIERVNKEKLKKYQECDDLTMKLFDAHLEKENLLNELLQMNKKNMKISSANLSESLIVKFDHLENKSSTINNDKLLEENRNLVKSCEELKLENSKLKQMVKVERENSKKSIQKYEREIAQLTQKVESMKKTNEYLAKQQEILNQQLMEVNKENSKIGDDSFHQKSPSVKSKPWSILDHNSPINDNQEEEIIDEPVTVEEKNSSKDNYQNKCAQQ
jgi:hypothetical protein